MKKVLDQALYSENKTIKIMTHVVAGYPDFETNLKTIQLMEKCGVNFVEIQIPFSEPIADGSIITWANQEALKKGANLEKVFAFIAKARKAVKIPFLVMTYYNIPYKMGLKKFLKKCENLGISGLIIPDIPFDEKKEDYINVIKNYDLYPIIVIAPSTSKERLKKLSKLAQTNPRVGNRIGFIYTTLKVGITGSQTQLNQEGLEYLKKIRKHFVIPLAAGFGISKKEQVKIVSKQSDIVVIGSHIINLLDHKGLKAVRRFLLEIRQLIL